MHVVCQQPAPLVSLSSIVGSLLILRLPVLSQGLMFRERLPSVSLVISDSSDETLLSSSVLSPGASDDFFPKYSLIALYGAAQTAMATPAPWVMLPTAAAPYPPIAALCSVAKVLPAATFPMPD